MNLVTAASEPAGGAALGEIAIATGAAMLLTFALLVLGMGHRSGRLPYLARWSKFAERVSGLPGWATLPSGIATVSLLTAVVGMYWDIALHIDVGRDEGPLANPAHYLILGGLFGIFTAGFIAMVLPKGRKPVSSSAIRLAPDWHAPLGGVLVCACGAFALIGFPLDDVWHRLFGQDVTLWGPTHLMLIGGASMTLVGMAVLLVEGRRARAAETGSDHVPQMHELSWVMRARAFALTGGFMLGLSTFQAEFDFGVPQFRFVFQPVLIMLAAGVGLVAVRIWAGRGAALGAALFFIAIRGGLALFVGPGLGETTPHFPLYLAEALIVEAVALRIAAGKRPLAFGLTCGVLIGTVGLAAEWGWSHVWMPLPWPSELLPEAAVLGFVTAMAAALVGAWIGARLDVEPVRGRSRSLRTGALVGAAGIAAVVGFALYKPADSGVRGTVALTEVAPAPERTVNARVTLTPRDAAADAEWITATAWQGDGLIVDRLRRVGEGVYETTRPIPVHGNWKSLVRLHVGNSLTAVPIFLPEDRAIPAREVPASPSFTREFIADHEILQREQKASSPVLTVAAYLAVMAIALSLLALLAWALHRLSRADAGGDDDEDGPSSFESPPPRSRSLQPA